MITTRTIWRWTRNTKGWPESNSTVEVIPPGTVLSWYNPLYVSLGWATPL